MAYRKFRDRDGAEWEIRDESDRRWVFRPLRGNEKSETSVTPPPRIDDPFDLSVQELQRLLDGGRPSGGGRAPGGGPRPRSPFLDDLE
jgi:hypothetical protein